MMFGWFKKKSEDTSEDTSVASLTFSADKNGVIWVKANWDAENHKNAHFMFAELLVKVSSGDMFLDTLVFIKELCEENESEEIYEEVLSFVRDLQESRSLFLFGNKKQGSQKKNEDLVVKPTDFFKLGKSFRGNDRIN